MDEEDGASDTSEERDESAHRLNPPATQGQYTIHSSVNLILTIVNFFCINNFKSS